MGSWNKDRSANVNTRWTISGDEFDVRANTGITGGTLWSVGFALALDTKDRMLIAGREIRRVDEIAQPRIEVKHNHALHKERAWTWTSIEFGFAQAINLKDYGQFDLNINCQIADNALPVQELFSTSGSLGILTDRGHFRTLGFREMGGDQSLSLFLEYRNMFPFSLPKVPVLGLHKWQPIAFAGISWSDMRNRTAELLSNSITSNGTYEFMQPTRTPFVEAGVGIGGILGFVRLDFAWRLNYHRENRNFMISLSLQR